MPMPRWRRLGWMNLHTYFKLLNNLWVMQWSLTCKKLKSSSVQSFSVCDLEATRSSQSSSHSWAFTHFSRCSHCPLTVVRGSTHSSSISSSSLGSPGPVSMSASCAHPLASYPAAVLDSTRAATTASIPLQDQNLFPSFLLKKKTKLRIENYN